jgi:hypothetical protein
MSRQAPAPLDGNAAAGRLVALFAVDVTAAVGVCAGCGDRGPLGAAALYVDAPGVVMRCRGCDAVLLRVVTAPDRDWVDLHGLAVLEISRPAG